MYDPTTGAQDIRYLPVEDYHEDDFYTKQEVRDLFHKISAIVSSRPSLMNSTPLPSPFPMEEDIEEHNSYDLLDDDDVGSPSSITAITTPPLSPPPAPLDLHIPAPLPETPDVMMGGDPSFDAIEPEEFDRMVEIFLAIHPANRQNIIDFLLTHSYYYSRN